MLILTTNYWFVLQWYTGYPSFDSFVSSEYSFGNPFKQNLSFIHSACGFKLTFRQWIICFVTQSNRTSCVYGLEILALTISSTSSFVDNVFEWSKITSTCTWGRTCFWNSITFVCSRTLPNTAFWTMSIIISFSFVLRTRTIMMPGQFSDLWPRKRLLGISF